MTHPIFSASTLAVQPPPGRLLLFIQQAQLTLVYGDRSESPVNRDGDGRL